MSKSNINTRIRANMPIYCGYYGNLRGEWLKKNQPEMFAALQQAGALTSYRDGYQRSYVAKARKLRPSIQKRVGLFDGLYEIDYPLWLAKLRDAEVMIREKLGKEIEQ